MTLQTDAGVPGSRITIDNADTIDVETLTAKWQADGSYNDIEGLVVEFTDGPVQTVLPAHPAGIEGGSLTLTIEQQGTICLENEVEIQPLEAAPGALDDLIAQTDAYLAARRTSADVTREELLTGDLSAAEPEIVALALMQDIYDGPDNPNSLVRLQDGTAEIQNYEPLDAELVNAVVAHHGMANWMQEQAALVEDQTSRRTAGVAQEFQAGLYQDIISPGDLADAMEDQFECESRLTGPAGDVRADIELAATGISLVGGPAGALLSGSLLVARIYDEYCAYMLPGEFSRIEVEHEPLMFEEDFDGDPGAVVEITVWATSAGWQITGVMIDVVLTMAGGVGAPAKISKQTLDITNAATAAVSNICGRLDSCADIRDQEILTLPPRTYGPVSGLTFGDWAEMSIRPAPEEAIEKTAEYLYEPINLGTSALSVRPEYETFGYETIEYEEYIEVLEISVDVQPEQVSLAPGELQTFNVTIDNAYYPELNLWTLVSPKAEEFEVGMDQDTYDFVAPDFETDDDSCETETQDWTLYVESTSKTGLRATSDEGRYDVANITVVKTPDPKNCPTPTPTPTLTPTPTITPTPSATPRPDQCLLGTWELDLDSYLAALQTIAPDEESQFTNVEGYSRITFTETEVTNDANLVLTISGPDGSLDFPSQQSGTTTYSADAERGIIMVAGGQESTGWFLGESNTTETEGAGAYYTCEGNELIIETTDLPPVIWNRSN
jgi:hypothetical protein